ncbi:MAG: hypothetical protein A3J74_08120 [Elusimicrobia bacterium RIFCSPHIGHO2_02_FULL_57_9]|nr:MAG: hypothetical protein A3J74_08120 [Elusimicrobia bacterium RIFCSPHIGHO2_02_FULL_57_9]
MDALFWIRAGAAMMFIVVAMGAFGAHALKDKLTVEMKAIFETAVRYQAYHALGLFVVAWLASRFPSKPVNMAGWCFLVGIILFSGSLYALSLTEIKKFGAIAPLGGLLFLLGWLALLTASCRS